MQMKKRISDDTKENVAITLDTNLKHNLVQLKKAKKIRKLSPRINAMLWEWINNEFQEIREEKTKG